VTVTKALRPNGFTILEIVVVLGVIAVIAAIAVPMFGNTLAEFRLSGDARSVSNTIAVAKMRAASAFTRVRVYVDLVAESHRVERWDKDTSTWLSESGATVLSPGVAFSFGVVSTAPPNTQATIDQAPECVDNAVPPVSIAGTACIMFNSRGVPIDSSFAPTSLGALYVTDGSAVYGITVAATGMLRMWRTLPSVTPEWTLN
jgi:prepilin-type N-terminal cleavage/methylation domain-containing protein